MSEVTSWDAVHRTFVEGAEVRNWGRARKYTGGRFRIVSLEPGSITVTSDGIRTPRRISRSDFDKVEARWRDYLEDRVSRTEITTISQNTTYIFSLLAALEAEG